MNLSTDAFAQFMHDAGGWGVAPSIGFMVIHLFIPFPEEFVAFANGLVYGPMWGSVITWVGAMLGAFAAFGVARWFGRPFVESIVPCWHRARLDRWSARSRWQAVSASDLIQSGDLRGRSDNSQSPGLHPCHRIGHSTCDNCHGDVGT
jgi:uncharacterized membrane protein YdjX (TVP38/TMEM64 family)